MRTRWLVVIGLAFGCSTPKPVVQPTVAIAGVDYTWKIIGHILTPAASIDERDAVAWNGREIVVTEVGYASPFQGTCEEAARTRRNRDLDELARELKAPHSIATDYQFASSVIEYRMTCNGRRLPPLSLYVDDDRAMTCYSGVCYFLRR